MILPTIPSETWRYIAPVIQRLEQHIDAQVTVYDYRESGTIESLFFLVGHKFERRTWTFVGVNPVSFRGELYNLPAVGNAPLPELVYVNAVRYCYLLERPLPKETPQDIFKALYKAFEGYNRQYCTVIERIHQWPLFSL